MPVSHNLKIRNCYLNAYTYKFIGPDYQKGHLNYFPRHNMEVIENAGHNMFLDQPEEFYRIVREHFKEGL